MKERLGKRIINNSVGLSLLIFLFEVIVKINTKNNLLDWSLVRILISSMIFGTILGTISSLFSNKGSKIFNTVVSVIYGIYIWSEINLFTYMGFFMGIGNAEQGTKITDYIKDFIMASKWQSYLVLVPLILYLLYIWIFKRMFRVHKLNKTVYFKFKIETGMSKVLTMGATLCFVLILGFLYYGTLRVGFMQNKVQSIKNTELIGTSDYSNLSVSQFGVSVYGVSDLIVTTFNIDISSDIDNNYSNNNNNDVITDNSRTIDDTAWKDVIANEKNSTYNKLNNYFINREITDKNEYTGIFEGKNLIVVLMESVNMISINEKEFPTIYKLWSEGISFRNNYSPRNNCSTGNNEMTSMTSLFTINNTCTANKYRRNVYPEAVFNVFNNAGYQTSSYHDYAEFYYYRTIIHPNMGSMKYRNVKDLNIKWSSVYQEWPSDVELVEKATPYFIDQDKFMVYLTSVTTHQPYTVSSENGDKHLSEFDEYDYSKPVKRYMSKMKELDAALKLLLENLEKAGKLDDTVIALFCDHYPYGLTTRQINSVLDYDVTVNGEVDRTPMIIYNSATKGQQITKYTSIIDLLPSLLNMFNLDYDPRLYLGHDVFSDYSDRTVFADGSWQDSIGYYSATTGKFSPKDESKTYTSDELYEINSEITTRQKMSALAIKNDYFNYRNKAITKYNNEHQTVTEVTESEE